MLGVDRDSDLVAHLFDERNEAVNRTIAHVIGAAHAAGRKFCICGQAPSDYPEFAEFLVAEGIDSLSLNADSQLKTMLAIVDLERRLAQGPLLLTYPSRHTSMRPLPNAYLHAAVVAGVAIQWAAASLPFMSDLLGSAAIPVELWGVVFGGALLAWGLAQACARLVWRQHTRESGGR